MGWHLYSTEVGSGGPGGLGIQQQRPAEEALWFHAQELFKDQEEAKGQPYVELLMSIYAYFHVNQ